MRFIVAASAAVTMTVSIGACRRIDEPPGPMAPPPATVTATQPAAPSTAETTTIVVPDFARVADKLSSSVVTVTYTVPGRATDPRKVVRGLGSGMIVSAHGQILTNQHVIAEAENIEVELSSRDRVGARLLYGDPLLDLALLELESTPDGLVPVEFSKSEPTPGEWVMAVGQPFGLGNTVTVGVISGLHRDHRDLGKPAGLDADGIWSFIQTDASINIGNSGGPLVDMHGKVVGITTAVRADGQGLAFATPAPMARRFLEEVWTHGRVRHARLGIAAEDVDGVLPGRGSVARITKVDPDGPGAKAALEVGDLVLAIDDKPISRVSEVAYLTQLRGVGANVTFTVKRGDSAAEQVVVVPVAR